MLVDLNENQTRSGNKVKYRNYKKREKDKGKCFYFSIFRLIRLKRWASVRFVFYFLFVVIRSAANIRLNFIFYLQVFLMDLTW